MKTTSVRQICFDIIDSIRKILPAVLSWLVGYPLSLLIKRDPDLTVIISRPGCFFADNSKYFYIYGVEHARKDERLVFLTTDRSIRGMIVGAEGESVLYPSLRSFYLLLKSRRIVMDWLMTPYIYPLTRSAKLVQIWHGAPLKHIELDIHRKNLERMPAWLKPFSRIKNKLIGRYPAYDLVVSTSQRFITEAFQRCFDAKQFIATGYPRNDILFGFPSNESIAYRLAFINVDKAALEAVHSAKAIGKLICLYVPTFRKDYDNPFSSKVDLLRLSDFTLKHNLIIVLKLHPAMHGHYQISKYPGLLEYAPLCDVYPLMPLCDLLITDYSSIYFDFLLLDRPILFFAYDLDNYLTQDRSMYFNYDAMTPGAICRTHGELEFKMLSIISNGCNDEYAEKREQVCSFTHDYTDNQSHCRLLELI